MVEITIEMLRQIVPECRDPGGWVAPLNTAMARFDINSDRRAAAFIAQIAEESAQLNRLEEILDYSAERLHQVWPTRFPSVDAARSFAHAPEKLANHVYANRLGNGEERSGDGWRFRGRGLLQITGRANYRQAATLLKRPYEESPELLGTPADAALSAAQFWQLKGLNELADSDDNFAKITERINGGLTGDAQRRQFWAQAKTTFDIEEA